jgi:hypothetical protein
MTPGQDLEQQRTADRRLDVAGALGQRPALAAHVLAQPHPAACLQLDAAALVGAVHLVHIGEHHAFAARADALARHVVKTQHHVL